MKSEVEQRVTKVHSELTEIQKQFENLANKAGSEARELRKHQEMLENERLKLHTRVAELDRREKRLNEFEDQCKEWEKRLEVKETQSNGVKDSQHLLVSVRQAEEEVEKDRFDLNDKLAQAEEARSKLMTSEKVLKEKVECLQNYLSFVEQQGVLPEAVHYRKLLKAVKHINPPGVKRVKCFISYAWQPDKDDNAKLQAKLVKIKGDLEKAGIEVMLDIHNMEGGTSLPILAISLLSLPLPPPPPSSTMSISLPFILFTKINVICRYWKVHGGWDSRKRSSPASISSLHPPLLLCFYVSFTSTKICTPRFRQRADEKSMKQNNLQIEFTAALQRQTQDPKFIIPIILEGDRATSISSALPVIHPHHHPLLPCLYPASPLIINIHPLFGPFGPSAILPQHDISES